MEPSMTAGATIALERLGVHFDDGTVALHDIDLTIPAGAFTVILGPSGSGKSTLLRTINRLVEPNSGRVCIDGADVAGLDPIELRRSVGYAIQAIGLFPHLTVGANVGIVPELKGWLTAEVAARVDELLTLVQLEPKRYRERFPHELSGGERARVGGARALAARPRVLLMDEPFGAIDPVVRAALQAEIQRIQRALGTTIVFVTHDIDEALRLADLLVVVIDGTIAQADAPERLLRAPASAAVRDLIGIDATTRAFADLRPIIERAP
jgi:osmoprotectant transport system ATP-binding protein